MDSWVVMKALPCGEDKKPVTDCSKRRSNSLASTTNEESSCLNEYAFGEDE